MFQLRSDDRLAVARFEAHGYEDNLPTAHSILAAKRHGGSKNLRMVDPEKSSNGFGGSDEFSVGMQNWDSAYRNWLRMIGARLAPQCPGCDSNRPAQGV